MDISIGGILVSVLLTYYTLYLATFLFKNKRDKIQNKNKELNKIRKVKFKTLKEQKRFLELKYPKSQKLKFTWKSILNFVFKIFVFIVIFRLFLFFITICSAINFSVCARIRSFSNAKFLINLF
jgi:hypothetical protein